MENELTLPENSRQRTLIKKVVASLSEEEKVKIFSWASKILEIQKSAISKRSKARQALKATKDAGIGKTTLKTLFSTAKRGGAAGKTFWNNRGRPAKIGISAAIATVAVFGTQGAGIAALGTAIGLPLWMVTGAGAMFAATLAEEAKRSKKSEDVVYFVPSEEGT